MNQMQYEKKNTAFDPFEPTTVLNRLRILGKELTFVDRCVIVYLLVDWSRSEKDIHLNQLQSFWDRREDVQSRNYASIKTKVTSLPNFNLPAYLVQDMIKQSEKIEAFE